MNPVPMTAAAMTTASAYLIGVALSSTLTAADAQPWQVLSALLALLELARRSELRLVQLRPFANVEILRDDASEAA